MNNFIPEIWAAEIIEDFPTATVGFGLCTTQYEGQIRGLGDKIHIPSAGSMTVQPYVAGTDIVPETLTSSEVELEITIAEAVSGVIDMTKQGVSPYSLTGIYQNKGSLALAKTTDINILKEMALNAHADNTIEAVLTPANIFQTLEECAVRLDLKDVPEAAEKFVVLTPRDISNIRKSTDYIPADKLDPATLITGQVGTFYGLRIVKSMNVHTQNPAEITSGNPVHRLLPFGMIGATAFANAIPAESVSATPMEKQFATLIKGLHMYGMKVIIPKAMGVIKVDTGVDGTL